MANDKEYHVNLKKAAIVLNGFVHDFASGYWLAALMAIIMLFEMTLEYSAVLPLMIACANWVPPCIAITSGSKPYFLRISWSFAAHTGVNSALRPETPTLIGSA